MWRGYIALWRKIQDHTFWKQKRIFSKAEAWIDILMEVRHSEEPAEVVIGDRVLMCNYGESLYSLVTWSRRWGWSKTKVRRFFKVLEKMHMAVVTNEGVTTRLRVVNYARYDPKQHAGKTAAKRNRRGRGMTSAPNKNVLCNNDVNERTREARGSFPSGLERDDFKKKWKEWLNYNQEGGRALGRATIERQLERCAEWGPTKAIQAIDKAIERGWHALYDPDESGAGQGRTQADKKAIARQRTLEHRAKYVEELVELLWALRDNRQAYGDACRAGRDKFRDYGKNRHGQTVVDEAMEIVRVRRRSKEKNDE